MNHRPGKPLAAGASAEVKGVIRRLRACREEERPELAEILAAHARSGSDAAFSELCRMAGGGGKGLFQRYSPAEMLIGIDALGRTGREDALGLLESWQEPEEVYVESCTGLACGSDHMPRWTALACQFPKAPRRLAQMLRYTGPASPPGASLRSLAPEEHAARRRGNPFHAALSHATALLASAIGKAEAALQPGLHQ